MPRLLITLLLLVQLLAGCNQEAMLEQMLPSEEVAIARDVVAKLAERNFASIEAMLGRNLQSPDSRRKLEQVASLMPAERPRSVRTVGAHTMQMNSVATYNLMFEYEFPDKWILANIVLERRNGKLTLEGIHLTPGVQSLEAVNRFTFERKGLIHYVVFVLVIAIPLFVVCALVICARTRIPRRKWLWMLCVAVGVVQFRFNWSNGAWDVQPMAFSLLGAGFAKMGPVAPWVFTLAFPMGAILFLLKRRSIQEGHDF